MRSMRRVNSHVKRESSMEKIDSLDDRLMFRLAKSKKSIGQILRTALGLRRLVSGPAAADLRWMA